MLFAIKLMKISTFEKLSYGTPTYELTLILIPTAIILNSVFSFMTHKEDLSLTKYNLAAQWRKLWHIILGNAK